MTGCLNGVRDSPGVVLWGFEHGFNVDGLRIIWEWNAIDPKRSILWRRFDD